MSRPRGRLGRALAAAGFVLLSMGPMPPTSFASTPPAAVGPAASNPSPASGAIALSIDAVEPPIAIPGDDVTIRGVVRSGAEALTGAQIVVRERAAPENRARVSWWANTADRADGTVLATAAVPATATGSATTGSTTGTADRTESYTVRIPAAAIADRSPFRVIPISVQLVQADGSVLATRHTFLIWHQRKEYERIEVAAVIPVTVPAEADLFADDATARERAWTSALGPESTVRRILAGTDEHEVTLAVEPGLVEPDVSGDDNGGNGTPNGTGDGTGTTPPTSTGTPTQDPSATPSTATPTEAPTDQPTEQPTNTTNPTTPPTTSPTTSPTSPGVDALVSTFVDGLAGRTLWALPYADADIAAAITAAGPGTGTTAGDLAGPVTGLLARTGRIADSLGHAVRTDIIWPVDGIWSDRRERTFTTWWDAALHEKPAAMIVSGAGITQASPYTPSARRTGTTGLRVLGVDGVLSSLLPAATPATPNALVPAPSGAQQTQRMLAETLVMLQERPGTARSILIAPPRGFDPDAVALDQFLTTLEATPWLQVVAADTLISTPAGTPAPAAVAVPKTPVAASAPPALLTGSRITEIGLAEERLTRIATVLADGADFERRYTLVLDELMSSRWRWAPTQWRDLLSAVDARTSAATTAIRVVSRSLNFFAEKGVIQVTVTNGLDYEIKDVRLVLTPTNPRMQVLVQPDPITIGARSQTVVKVEAAAVAVGPSQIRAHLTTTDGTEIGQEGVISIQANPLDRTIYTVGGLIVGLVLIAGVVRSLLRGTSRAQQIEPPAN